jgi:hypothetical protein
MQTVASSTNLLMISKESHRAISTITTVAKKSTILFHLSLP